MDIKKFYECLSVDERKTLINLVVAELSRDKTDIMVFIELYKDDMPDSLKHALKWAYTGRYHRYQCTYVEDIDLTKMASFSGIGTGRINKLDYLIRLHKNPGNEV